MSRIGRKPIVIPKNVKIHRDNGMITVEGPKGKLSYTLPNGIALEIKENEAIVSRSHDTKTLRAYHGLSRALIANMVEGTANGFKKELEVIGVGYKVQLKGSTLHLQLGFSHPVEMTVWEGLKVTVPSATRITIEGFDKQQVGEFAARVRKVLPPEPYKGKGIRYVGEEVRKKLGKAMAK